MPLPFRNNPEIVTNWVHHQKGKVLPEKGKKSYYDISIVEGKLRIKFHEEKKKTATGSKESLWFAHMEFPLDSQFARDLKMFLDEHVQERINAEIPLSSPLLGKEAKILK